MKSTLILSITGLILTILLTGIFTSPVSPPPKSYDLIIMKIGEVWKVVDAADHNNTKVNAKRKDTITWTIKGSDAYLQFPDKLFNPVSADDSLHNGYTKKLKDGKKLKLKVKDDAALGTYEYAVFCTADGVFAQGDSPPKIVIK
jgi:hypothetical protein